jgi:hypothetical protein
MSNLLAWLPKLAPEDFEVIAVAVHNSPSDPLPKADGYYYRDAAKRIEELALLRRGRVIADVQHLASQDPFWPQVRDTLRKLRELEESS